MMIIKEINKDYRRLLMGYYLYSFSTSLIVVSIMLLFVGTVVIITSWFNINIGSFTNYLAYALSNLQVILVIFFLIGFIYPSISSVNKLRKIEKNNREIIKDFLNSRFANVYYLVVLKYINAINQDELEVKKAHLLGKKHFSPFDFYLLAKYRDYLGISYNEFEIIKFNFINSAEMMSIFSLNRLIKIKAVLPHEINKNRVNLDHYILIINVICIIFDLYIIMTHS